MRFSRMLPWIGVAVFASVGLAQEARPPSSLPDLPRSGARIPWADFKTILQELREARVDEDEPKPPVGFTLGECRLSGAVAEDGKSLTFDLALEVSVIATEGEWVELPLFGPAVAVESATLDGAPAPLVASGNRLVLTLNAPGRHRLAARLAVPVNEHQGNFTAAFEYWPAPLTEIELEVPLAPIEFTSRPGVVASRTVEGGRSRVRIALPLTQHLTLNWRKETERVQASQSGVGRTHAAVATVITMGEGVASATTTVSYELFQRKLDRVEVAIPAGVRLLDVQGAGLGTRQETTEGEALVFAADLNFEAEKSYRLVLTYERDLKTPHDSMAIPRIDVRGVDRQQGLVGVGAAGSVEVSETSALSNLAPLDITELPADFTAGSSEVLFAYRYVRVPYEVTFDVRRHEDLEVKRSIIEEAELLTYVTEQGQLLTRGRYTIKNNQKQYLEVTLPQGASLWGSYLAGRPVKAASKGDAVLLPLEKVRTAGDEARTFDLELVYYREGSAYGMLGRSGLQAPSTDLECLQLRWLLYLPSSHAYHAFDGDLEFQGTPTFVAPPPPQVVPKMVVAGEPPPPAPSRSMAMSNVMTTQAYGYQFEGGEESGEAKGVLPVRIEVPTEGVRVVAQKRVVSAGESAALSFRFVKKAGPRRTDGILFGLSLLFAVSLISLLRRGLTPSVGARRSSWWASGSFSGWSIGGGGPRRLRSSSGASFPCSSR